jgi:hypothetical protein
LNRRKKEMQYRVLLSAATIAFGLAVTSSAQGPVGDEVMVTFDRPVQVGSQTLAAGKYTIRQLTSASNPRVLEFTSDYGTKLDATITAIPVLDNTPPSKTRVILDEESGTPRLARIWVQGKSYGYEFPGHSAPATTASNGVTLVGTFAPQPAPVVAQTAPPPPPPAPAVIAQNQTPAPAPEPAPAPAATPPPPPPNEPAPAIPATALNWVQIALLGLCMASAGCFLYWRERVR